MSGNEKRYGVNVEEGNNSKKYKIIKFKRRNIGDKTSPMYNDRKMMQIYNPVYEKNIQNRDTNLNLIQ
jgi:hypothetical protein